MHSGSMHAILRLWHKCGMQAVTLCYSSDRQLKGHNIVSGSKRLIVFKINFMLTGSYLVMGRLDFKAHFFQCQHHIPSCVLSQVHRTDVKITGFFMGGCGGLSAVIRVKQEEFTLRTDLESISHILRFPDHFLEDISGISLESLTICAVYVTDQSGNLSLLGTPGKNLKRIIIRIQIQVGFLDSYKTID